MGGELVKSPEINAKSSRNMATVGNINSKTSNLKRYSIKDRKNSSFSNKKIKRKISKKKIINYYIQA